MLEQVAGTEQSAWVELELHRAHHAQLHRGELQRQPPTLDLPDPMLRRDGAAEGDDMTQRRLDDRFHARELLSIAGDEVLMRMAVPRVTIDHGLPDPGTFGEATRLANRFLESPVRDGPIRRHPSTARWSIAISTLDHGGGHAMTQPACVPERGRAVVHEDVALRGPVSLGEREPALERDLTPRGGGLLQIHQRTGTLGPPSRALRCARDVQREAVEIL